MGHENAAAAAACAVRKVFFFEKKKQKAFADCAQRTLQIGQSGAACNG
jgi:hypothetical protein